MRAMRPRRGVGCAESQLLRARVSSSESNNRPGNWIINCPEFPGRKGDNQMHYVYAVSAIYAMGFVAALLARVEP